MARADIQMVNSIDTNTDANGGAIDENDAPATDKTIFLVSDGTGSTLKKSVEKSLGQFDPKVNTRVFTFVRGETVAASIIKMAEAKNAMIISTIIKPSLREEMQRMCEMSQVQMVDIIGPTLDGLSTYLKKVPTGVPKQWYAGRSGNRLSDNYYRRIEAVEFTLKADDGRCPWLLKDADVILLGVSRTGKTPLSVVLSQMMGLKVANIPLVLEVAPPKELLDVETIDPRRVFVLEIAPSELKRTRTTRLEERGVKATEEKNAKMTEVPVSNYNTRNYILKDLKSARELSQRQGYTQIDVTGRAVEETASHISEIMNERYDNIFVTTLDN